MKLKLFHITLILVIALTVSCDPQRVFDQYIAIDDEGWDYNDKVNLEVEILDTTALHTCFVNVRNTTDYAFSNLYLFIKTIFPNGRVSKDTLQIQLADKNGKWLGKGNGKIRDNQVLLIKNIRFPYQGIYIFEITQGMRKKKLKGIADIGLRIVTQ